MRFLDQVRRLLYIVTEPCVLLVTYVCCVIYLMFSFQRIRSICIPLYYCFVYIWKQSCIDSTTLWIFSCIRYWTQPANYMIINTYDIYIYMYIYIYIYQKDANITLWNIDLVNYACVTKFLYFLVITQSNLKYNQIISIIFFLLRPIQSVVRKQRGALLLTWIHFNPSIIKQSRARWSVGWNYFLSITKL